MNDDIHFLRETVVNIDAAVVGISSSSWVSASAESTEESARSIMEPNRFDILPIENPKGVREYFKTDIYNQYSAISRHAIGHRDVVPFSTPIRTIVERFSIDKRTFLFLVNERRIVGLITLSNLNCRQVSIYLFSLFTELEVKIGNLLMKNCKEDEIKNLTFENSNYPKHRGIKNRYKEDKENGVEIPVVEYLYLSDLINLIETKKFYRDIGLQDDEESKKILKDLNKTRNTAAHPIKSIILDLDSCCELWKQIELVENILFYLR